MRAPGIGIVFPFSILSSRNAILPIIEARSCVFSEANSCESTEYFKILEFVVDVSAITETCAIFRTTPERF